MGDDTDLTAEEFATWVRAPDALKLFKDVSWEGRIRALSTRIKTGLLRTAAETARFRNTPEHRLFEIVPDVWMHWSAENDEHLWETGDTNIPMLGSDQVLSAGHLLFDVRFEPGGLRRMGATPPGTVVERVGTAPIAPEHARDQPVRHAGGRPPKPYWEPLLIEMIRQYADGALQPTRQADVERAMLDWLASQGQHDASERSVRSRAKLVWEAIKTEGQ